jgi:hypothetical protein
VHRNSRWENSHRRAIRVVAMSLHQGETFQPKLISWAEEEDSHVCKKTQKYEVLLNTHDKINCSVQGLIHVKWLPCNQILAVDKVWTFIVVVEGGTNNSSPKKKLLWNIKQFGFRKIWGKCLSSCVTERSSRMTQVHGVS